MRLLGSTSHFVMGLLGGLIGKVGILSGAFGTLAGAAAGARAVLSGLTLSGIMGSVTGALSGFAGWLAAGSAGALAFAGALGFGLGLLGVWALETTGALDAVKGFGTWVANKLPPSVRDGVLNVLSIITGPLALVGAMIVGFFEDGWSGAVRRGKEIIGIFVGSWERSLGRIKGAFGDAVNWLKTKMGNIKQTFVRGWSRIKSGATDAAGRVKSAFGNAATDIRNTYNDVKASVVGGFNSMKQGARDFMSGIGDAAVNTVRSGFNAAIPAKISLPSTTINIPEVAGGGSFSIGGQSLNLPQLQVGGMVEETGAAVVHKGEAVVPEPVVDAVGTSGGGTSGGGTSATVVENMVLNFDGEFDPTNLSRRDAERLAEKVADALGESTTTQAGTR